MRLWSEWWVVVSELRSACARSRTFLWMAVALAGLCIREDLAGVTSVVRVFGLRAHLYDRILDFFHTSALDPDRLSRRWTAVVLRVFPDLLRVGGRLVLLADGIKVPKAGRKMPAVKRLKQVESNTKPEFIFGHSCQAISVVAGAESSAFAVPLSARIHEGLIFTNRDHRAQPRKLVLLLDELGIGEKVTLVADAYYACETIGRVCLPPVPIWSRACATMPWPFASRALVARPALGALKNTAERSAYARYSQARVTGSGTRPRVLSTAREA